MAKSYTGETFLIGTADDPVRAAFTWLDKPRPPKPKPNVPAELLGPGRFEITLLLEPKVAAHKAVMERIKSESLKLIEQAGLTPKQIKQKSFGTEDDLDKVPDGFAGKFWIKCREQEQPVILGRGGKTDELIYAEEKKKGKKGQWPYGGAWVIGKASLWLYTNETFGIGANIKVVQFVRHDTPFGRPQETADEFGAIKGLAGDAAADPFAMDEAKGGDEDDFMKF